MIKKSYENEQSLGGFGLNLLLEFLKVTFSTSADHLRDRIDRCYKVYIEGEEEFENDDASTSGVLQNDKSKKVNFWCFNPAFG